MDDMFRTGALKSIVLVLLIFCSTVFPSAQESEQQPPRHPPAFRVTSTVYTVDAIITDGKGRQVSDLTREDFEIESGERVYPVENCSYLPLEPTDPVWPEQARLRLRPSEVRRVFVFVISTPLVAVSSPRGSASFAHVALAGVHDAARILTTFVDKQMRPGDLAAVIWVDGDNGALCQVTNDREMLRKAIASRRSQPIGHAPTSTVFITPRGIDASSLMQQNLRAVSAVSQAIDYIKVLPGRKVVVFASRFLLHRLPRLPEGETVADAISDVVDKANRNAVVIYSMDLRGLDSRGPSPFEPPEGLFHLANETGGRAFMNENDLSRAMGRILEENRGYYLLGFKIGEKEPEPRKIKVRVKRKGLRLQARAAAFSSSSLVTIARSDEPVDLSGLVNSPLRLGELELSLAPTLHFPDNGPVEVVSYLGLDFAKLQLEDGPQGTKQARLETVVQIIGPNGKVVLNEAKQQGFGVEKQKLEEAGREGFVRLYGAKTAGAGHYQVRASVRDLVSGKSGNVSAVIEVPNRNPRELYLSEVLFGNPREGKISFEPYRFDKPENPRYGLWVLPGKDDKPVEVHARILSGDQVVATWRPIRIDKTTPPPAFLFDRIELSWCQPGRYTLLVTATQGKRSLERKAEFEVR